MFSDSTAVKLIDSVRDPLKKTPLLYFDLLEQCVAICLATPAPPSYTAIATPARSPTKCVFSFSTHPKLTSTTGTRPCHCGVRRIRRHCPLPALRLRRHPSRLPQQPPSPNTVGAPSNPPTLSYAALSFGFLLAVNAWIFFRISGGLV